MHKRPRRTKASRDSYTIVIGGAYSSKEGKSWRPEEMPTAKEDEHALDTLDQHDWRVDYVITHCAPIQSSENLETGMGAIS